MSQNERSCRVCGFGISKHQRECLVSNMSLVELSYAATEARREVIIVHETVEKAMDLEAKSIDLSTRLNNELAARIQGGEGFVK